MILNQYLPPEELQATLSKNEFQDLEFILKNLLPPDKRINSIFNELELLGQIHHAINLENYRKKEFRKDLFQFSLTILKSTWEKYFSECGVKQKISEMTESKRSKNVKKFVEFNWGDNERTRKFVEFFNYPYYIIPDKAIELEIEKTIFGENGEFEPLKMLLNFQSPVVYKTLKHIESLNARCLIQMPTGTGKTRTAIEIISNLFNQNKEIQIVWFANKSELLEQAREAFIHVWKHVGKYPIKVINVWGNKPIPEISENSVIVFAGYQKLNNFLRMGKKLKPHYIVVDEAHQILAPTYNYALRKLANFENSTRVIGLTATPGRGIDEQQNKLLVDEFQTNIRPIELDDDDKKIYENDIVKYLEDEDVLAKCVPKPIETDIEYDLSDDEWENLRKLVQGDHPDYSTEFLKKLASDNTRNILIIDKLKEYADKGKKILYFSTNKPQSILVFAALQKLGVKAIHVDADTDPSFRRQIIKKFKDTDEINVICNFDIYSTGFDVPKLDVVFIGRPVNSPVLFNQMVGRGTRGPKMNGGDSFILVQVIDKIKSRFVDFDPYSQYGFWDDNWRK